MHQILAVLFNLITVIWYTIKSCTHHQNLNAKTSMSTKLLLISHTLGHLATWITIHLCLNQFTYLSIALSILICLSLIKLGNVNCARRERQIWMEVLSPSKPDLLTDLISSWIAPATFLTKNPSKLYFPNVSTLRRKSILIFTSMATTLLLLIHLSSIALLLHLTDIFEPSNETSFAR